VKFFIDTYYDSLGPLYLSYIRIFDQSLQTVTQWSFNYDGHSKVNFVTVNFVTLIGVNIQFLDSLVSFLM